MLRALCSCDGDDSLFSVENILMCQKLGDFFIAASYFSISLELLYFATCSTLFLFKWVVVQFIAFIVLCALSHLLTVFTYEPHTFLLIIVLTIFKFLTALVSFATAITLLTLIPKLLKVKVRESYLRIKARQLDQQVGMMKRQEEASWHVRMLTQEIRKSLNRHTILYTTMVELSNTLGLQNCAVWMPDKEKKEMNLTHELKERNSVSEHGKSIPTDDPDVIKITESNGVRLLNPDSLLGTVTSRGELMTGPVSAIRMPILKVSDFVGGTPKTIETCYAILVLVLPEEFSGVWNDREREIIEAVADQVAVALSHAAVLEESQNTRDKLAEQNRLLLQAKQDAQMANNARDSFQKAMSQGMRKPVHSIIGLISMMQQEKISSEQRLIVNAMAKTSGVVSKLVDDVMHTSNLDSERLTLEMRPFELHTTIKEASSVIRVLCDCKGIGFDFQIDFAVKNLVIGDEKRIFHVILHMVGTLLTRCDQGFLTFHVHRYNEDEGGSDQGRFPWKLNFSGDYTSVKFEIELKRPQTDGSSSSLQPALNLNGLDLGLRFDICKKLVQMMRGNIKAFPISQGNVERISLVLQIQLQSHVSISELGGSSERYHSPSPPNFRGIRVILTDNDNTNRAVTRKLLEKLGFNVTSFSSGSQCLSSISTFRTPFQLVIIDMESFEVAMRIQNLKSGSWPLIVVLTARSDEETWRQCMQSSINGLIRKPVTLQTLRDELYRVLKSV